MFTPRASIAVASLVAIAASLPAIAQFETRGTYPTLQSPQSIAVGDFNNDGNLDVPVACYFQSQQVTILLGNGDGTFQPAVNYAAGAEPYSVAAADFNNDRLSRSSRRGLCPQQ
jgi:hypothetical protein